MELSNKSLIGITVASAGLLATSPVWAPLLGSLVYLGFSTLALLTFWLPILSIGLLVAGAIAFIAVTAGGTIAPIGGLAYGLAKLFENASKENSPLSSMVNSLKAKLETNHVDPKTLQPSEATVTYLNRKMQEIKEDTDKLSVNPNDNEEVTADLKKHMQELKGVIKDQEAQIMSKLKNQMTDKEFKDVKKSLKHEKRKLIVKSLFAGESRSPENDALQAEVPQSHFKK